MRDVTEYLVFVSVTDSVGCGYYVCGIGPAHVDRPVIYMVWHLRREQAVTTWLMLARLEAAGAVKSPRATGRSVWPLLQGFGYSM